MISAEIYHPKTLLTLCEALGADSPEVGFEMLLQSSIHPGVPLPEELSGWTHEDLREVMRRIPSHEYQCYVLHKIAKRVGL